MTGIPQQIVLKRFDPSSMKDNRVMFIIGHCNAGKSMLSIDIIKHITPKLGAGTVLGPDDRKISHFKQLSDEVLIHEYYTPEIGKEIIQRQTQEHITPHFLIADGCIHDPFWQRDPPMRYMFLNSQRLQLTIIFTMVYAVGVVPALRVCVDYVFIYRENLQANRRKIYDQYASTIFPSYELFCTVMDALNNWGEYICLVFDNTSTSKNIEDRVFYYKAQYEKNT
jgi:hypothetical protein